MDRLEINVQDDELRGEIQLVADLMIAANQSKGHLSGVDIDVLLGLIAQPYDTGDGSKFVDGSSSVDGSRSVDGSSSVDGSKSVDGSSSVDGSKSVDGSSPVDGSSSVDGSKSSRQMPEQRAASMRPGDDDPA